MKYVSKPRPRAGDADAAFLLGIEPRGLLLSVPVRYLGDEPRRVTVRNGAREATELEPGLYPERAGQPCRLVEDLGAVPYPYILDFGNWRGIARREAVEVLR